MGSSHRSPLQTKRKQNYYWSKEGRIEGNSHSQLACIAADLLFFLSSLPQAWSFSLTFYHMRLRRMMLEPRLLSGRLVQVFPAVAREGTPLRAHSPTAPILRHEIGHREVLDELVSAL